MIIKNLIDEDFSNYKKPNMFIGFPKCTFKCGKEICQNAELMDSPGVEVTYKEITDRYLSNPLTSAIVFGGLEPFDSPEDLLGLIDEIRSKTLDDIVVYTGYHEEELTSIIQKMKIYKNIIIKFGPYIEDDFEIDDPVLGVKLASSNQYAKIIS